MDKEMLGGETPAIKVRLDFFDLGQIADSGQAFRMLPLAEESLHAGGFEQGYHVISGPYYLEVFQKGCDFVFCCTSEAFEYWEGFFDLNTDYGEMLAAIGPEDIYLSSAAKYGCGVRILRQDVWEMIITFIISQQKTIPKIREAIELLSTMYGTAYVNFRGETYYSFPTPEQLAVASEDELRALKLGYRAKYIYRTCQDAVGGRLDLSRLATLDYSEAMNCLMSLYGIGEKVANCVCLFGLHHIDAFPVDTWIQKILLREYFRPEYEKLPKTKLFTTIIQEHFGMYKGFSGVMQQYIFFYERAMQDKLR